VERNEWVDAITNTTRTLQKTGTSESLAMAPVWKPNDTVNTCDLCPQQFSMTNRQHHCRACSIIVCDSCPQHRIVLAHLDTDAAVRVCDLCHHASGHSEESPSISGSLAAQEVRAAPVASITVNLVLEITLQSARGLKNMDTFSLSDPFVDISMQPFGRRSRVIDDNLNPEWTEKFILPWEGSSSSSSSSSKILTFEVFDRDVVFNGTSSLNHIMICLSKYICHTTTARTYRECQAVCE
jgi:hypothetical protein